MTGTINSSTPDTHVTLKSNSTDGQTDGNNSSQFHVGWVQFCNVPSTLKEFRLFCLQHGLTGDSKDTEPEAPWSLSEPDIPLGHKIYIYVIPFILLVGITGNIISLIVFSQPRMKSSATCYLTVLCSSDLVMVLTFVGVKYLDLGLPYLLGTFYHSVIAIRGVCQVYVYIVHVCRAVSAWIIVVFSVERYVAVCMPLRRRVICSRTLSIRCLAVIILVSSLLCLYKPIYSTVVSYGKVALCHEQSDMIHVVHILDTIYGNLITLVPFFIIAVVNIGILRALIFTQRQDISIRSTHSHKLRREFTLILVAVSFCFVCFNVPYYITWVLHNDVYRQHVMKQSQSGSLIDQAFLAQQNDSASNTTMSDDLGDNGSVLFTRTVFSFNYCTNFLLYCITGTYFRSAVKQLCRCKQKSRSSGCGTATQHTSVTECKAGECLDTQETGMEQECRLINNKRKIEQ